MATDGGNNRSTSPPRNAYQNYCWCWLLRNNRFVRLPVVIKRFFVSMYHLDNTVHCPACQRLQVHFSRPGFVKDPWACNSRPT